MERKASIFKPVLAEVCGPIRSGGALCSVGITATSALGAANVGGTLLAGRAGDA